MPNDEEIKQNLFDVKNAVAQQRLEGLTPSLDVVTDLERAACGKKNLSCTVRRLTSKSG